MPKRTQKNRQRAATGTTTTKTAEDEARGSGLDYLTDTLNKENPALMLEGRRQMDELSARQQQERSALEQRLLQEGVDPGRARLESQMLRDKQETERNDLGAQYGIAGMQARDTAAANLASQGLAGQQFEQDKKQYGDSKAWTDFEYTAQYGSDSDVIAAYKAATGKTLDPSAVAEIRGYARAKRGQDITAGDLANDASRLGLTTARMQAMISDINNGVPLATINSTYGQKLTEADYSSIGTKYKQSVEAGATELARLKNVVGDEMYDSIQDMINSGSSLAAVNDRLAEQGKAPITGAEFTSMLEATPLGERNWGRKLTAANMLLTNMNFDQAAEAYAEIFPGVTFDFTNLKNEKKGEDFASGMSELASYVAAGIDVKTAISMAWRSGAISKMGIDPTRATEYFNAMKVNAVDAEWEDMENSDFYKGLSTEEQTDQREFFKQKMLGQLDYTTLHEYEIYNPDGTLNMTVHGKDSTEADKKAASLGSGYTVKDTGKVKFQMASTITSVSDINNKKGTVSDKPVGTVYVDQTDKRVYKVGAGGVIEEMTPDATTDAWTIIGDDIVAAGAENNPYYKDIINERAKSIVEGTHPDAAITDQGLYDATLKVANNFEGKTVKTGSGSDAKYLISGYPRDGTVINYQGKLYKVIGKLDEVSSFGTQNGTWYDYSTGRNIGINTNQYGIKVWE